MKLERKKEKHFHFNYSELHARQNFEILLKIGFFLFFPRAVIGAESARGKISQVRKIRSTNQILPPIGGAFCPLAQVPKIIRISFTKSDTFLKLSHPLFDFSNSVRQR